MGTSRSREKISDRLLDSGEGNEFLTYVKVDGDGINYQLFSMSPSVSVGSLGTIYVSKMHFSADSNYDVEVYLFKGIPGPNPPIASVSRTVNKLFLSDTVATGIFTSGMITPASYTAKIYGDPIFVLHGSANLVTTIDLSNAPIVLTVDRVLVLPASLILFQRGVANSVQATIDYKQV